MWLKVPAPGNAFEAHLYRILLEVAPNHVLNPIAEDTDTGWLLLPDGGPPLAEVAEGDELVEATIAALPQYAELQRAMTSRTEELIGLGLGDLRPDSLPHRLEIALAAMNTPPLPLVELVPTFTSWCLQLTSYPIAATIDHNDLHPWNILGFGSDGNRTDRAIFYDWGDSVVGHPFGSSREPISRVRRLARLRAGHRDVRRMRDAYLEVFDDIIPRTDAIELIELAWKVAKTGRAVVWGGTRDDMTQYLKELATGDLDI